MTTKKSNIRTERENETIMTKLDRILELCNLTIGNIEDIERKYGMFSEIYNETNVKEDLKLVSNNTDLIMKNVESSFKNCLIVPRTCEDPFCKK